MEPDSSKIVFPATYKETLDWDTINKLTGNSDFEEFLESVKIDVSSSKIHKGEYDNILEPDELLKIIKNDKTIAN
jgi:hypothetical protein